MSTGVIQKGIHLVIGIPLVVKPLVLFPEGKKRIRMRNNDAVRVFVKTKDGITEYVIKECEGGWMPAFRTRVNHRAP